MLLEYHLDWIKIVDILLIAKFLASLDNYATPSTILEEVFSYRLIWFRPQPAPFLTSTLALRPSKPPPLRISIRLGRPKMQLKSSSILQFVSFQKGPK